MSRNQAGRRTPLSILDPMSPGGQSPAGEEGETPLRRAELSLRTLADELAQALEHVERSSLAAKGTGFSARVRDAFDELDRIQRSAAAEFGRKVGDRMGRESLWRTRRGVDIE